MYAPVRHVAALLLALLAAVPAAAAELVMVEQAGCPWCAAFDREIGPIYPKTDEAERAPLRRIDISDPIPEDLELDSRPRVTPTFILVDDGEEVARIEGYPGEDLFWMRLHTLFETLDAEAE